MKKITLEVLAEMVQRGFLEQEEKFNKKFKVLEMRMDAFEKNMEEQLDQLRGELHEVKDQIGIIDSRAEVETSKIRIERIEKQLKAKSGFPLSRE